LERGAKFQQIARLTARLKDPTLDAPMKMGEESNSKQPNPNTMPVPKTAGVTEKRDKSQ
jgi:hypothetical protein